MTDYEKKRDKAAEKRCADGFADQYLDAETMFKEGADWATAHWLEQVRVLTDALEVVSRRGRLHEVAGFFGQDPMIDICNEALKRWAELTKPSEGEL